MDKRVYAGIIVTVFVATGLYAVSTVPTVHGEQENKVLQYDVEQTICRADHVKDVSITAGEFLSNGAREIHIDGTWTNGHQGNEYPVDLRMTGDQTLMMLIQRDPPRVSNGSACIIPEEGQGVWGMNFSATLRVHPGMVETLRVYYNGEPVGKKRYLGVEHTAGRPAGVPPQLPRVTNMTYWVNETMHDLNDWHRNRHELERTLVKAVDNIHHVPVQGSYMNCTSSLRENGVVEATFAEPVYYKLDANGYPHATTFSLPTTGQPLIFDGCTMPGATDSPVGSTVDWQADVNQTIETLLEKR